MTKRLLLSLAFLILVTAGFVAVGVPRAGADPVCNSGEFCIWGNINYGGDFWDPSGSDPDWPCGTLCSPDVDNSDDSVRNREGTRSLVFTDDDYMGGLLYCVESGELEDDINSSRDNAGESSYLSSITSCGTYPRP